MSVESGTPDQGTPEPRAVPRQTQDGPSDKAKPHSGSPLHRLEKISHSSTALLAIIGGIGAIIYWRQLDVMNLQLAQMEKASKQTEKSLQIARRQLQVPWVGIDQSAISGESPRFLLAPVVRRLPSSEIEVPTTFLVKNFGGAPAFREQEGVLITPYGAVVDVQFPDACQSLTETTRLGFGSPASRPEFQSGKMILPGAAVKIDRKDRFDWAEPHQLVALYVHICIVYQDADQQWHHSRYVFYSNPTADATPILSPYRQGWSFVPWTSFSLLMPEQIKALRAFRSYMHGPRGKSNRLKCLGARNESGSDAYVEAAR